MRNLNADQGARLPSLLALVAVLAFAREAEAQRPTMPRVRSQPCEGYCQPTWASCRRVALRAAPAINARVVGLVDSGQVVRVLEGLRITTRPGLVVVRRTHVHEQRLSGSDGDVVLERPKRWRLQRGDTIYVVDKETDGDSYANYIWQRRGQEDTTAAFWGDAGDDLRIRLLAPMEQMWWARVRSNTGLIGWTPPGDEWSGRSYYDDPATKCARNAPRR